MADSREPRSAGEPVLLSGGNPQIPKGDGDVPVADYIAAMPGWKHDVGRRIDDLVVRTVPDVRKAVRWNSPFWGLDDNGWFLSLHCFTKYIKIAFLNGVALTPLPPVEAKHETTRYVHVLEDSFDEVQFQDWVKQASKAPGDPVF